MPDRITYQSVGYQVRGDDMRIFVAGATGAIGRPLVAKLVRAGHTVFGLTRSPEKAALLREIGAEPVVGDALDPAAIHAAVHAARPERTTCWRRLAAPASNA